MRIWPRRKLVVLLVLVLTFVPNYMSVASGQTHQAGLGSTVSQMRSSYSEDKNLATHCCWGPIVNNPSDGRGPMIYEAIFEHGRLVEYSERFIVGTTLTVALSEIKKALPSDVSLLKPVGGTGDYGPCEMVNGFSKTLANLMGRSGGHVGIEFDAVLPNGNLYFNPSNVQDALISNVPVNPRDGC